MRKALIIAPVYPLGQTDKEDYIKIPAGLMRELGCEVEVLTLGGPKEENINGLRVKRFPNTISLILYALSKRSALIHTNLRPFLPSILAGLLPSRKVHTPMSDVLGSNRLIKFLSLAMYKRYDKILAHTPYGKQLFLDNGLKRERVELLPLPVDTGLFSAPKSAKGKNMLKLKTKPFIITCVANFRGIKGVHVLLKAFSLFRKKAKNSKLVLVGKDFLAEEGKPTIRQMTDELKIGADVMHLGFLQAQDVKAVLDASDVFCISSSVDAQCLSIYEAAAGSIPLCLSNLPSFTSVFKSAALYHEVGNAKELAENLLSYYKDAGLRKTNGAKGRKHASVADYKVIRKRLKALYEELLR